MINGEHKYNIALCLGDLIGAKFVLRGLCGGLDEHRINLHIFHGMTAEFSGEKQEIGQINIYNLANYDKMDMLIVAPFFLSSEQEIVKSVIDKALKAGKPVITMGIKYDGCYCVMSDYSNDIEQITTHVIKKHGCKDIVCMSGFEGDYVSEQRILGFKRALEKNGLEYNRDEQIYFGEFWDYPAVTALEKILARQKPIPEAIICANDTMAGAVVRRLTELNYKIPQDIIVTGMDGIDEASGYITTAVIFSELTGKITADLAADILINGKTPPEMTIVPTDIDLGASCGCIKDDVGTSAMKRHELFEDLYNSRKYMKDTMRLTQELANCKSYDKMVDMLYYTLSKIWSVSGWICICDDFFNVMSSDDIDSADALASFNEEAMHTVGYSENMNCIAAYRQKAKIGSCVFKSADILPDFYSVADESSCILYSPLFYRDSTIGYIAYDYFPWSNLVYILNVLTTGISTTLESVRRQNQLIAYAKKVDELYVTDSLTGLYNRRGFFRLYGERKSAMTTKSFMVVSVDLDNLKQINDNFGHNEGDNAISVVSAALKSAAEKDDIAARFGGDEFIVLGYCENEYNLNDYTKRVFEYLENYNKTSGKPYNVHASCGSCLIPAGSDMHIDYYINQADSKMYLDKEQHKRKRGLFRNSKSS